MVKVSCTKLIIRGASGKLILSRIRYLGTSQKTARGMGTSIPLGNNAVCLHTGFSTGKSGVGTDRNNRSLLIGYGLDCDASNGGFRPLKRAFRMGRNG